MKALGAVIGTGAADGIVGVCRLSIHDQLYNLAHLDLAMPGGLIATGYFTSVHYVVITGALEAVHRSFMMLG